MKIIFITSLCPTNYFYVRNNLFNIILLVYLFLQVEDIIINHTKVFLQINREDKGTTHEQAIINLVLMVAFHHKENHFPELIRQLDMKTYQFPFSLSLSKQLHLTKE